MLDEAESALLKTLTNMKAVRASLLDKKDLLDNKISRLQGSVAQLEANIRDKDACMKIDSRALMLDGRKEVDRAPSVASLAASSLPRSQAGRAMSSRAGSNKSSTRESIMSRLSHLEEDLRQTQETNQALERSIAEYTAQNLHA